MRDTMKKRIIPTKNYVIFAIISLLSFALVYNLGKWYKNNVYEEEIMTTVITEVLGDEFDAFIIENSNIVVYMASSEEDNINDFEKEFKKYIIKEELQGEIIYFDISKYNNEAFYNDFHNRYFNQSLLESNKKLTYFPNIVVFQEHKVTSMLYENSKDINISDVKIFIENSGVLE
jgi:hypothetical protein